MFHISNSNITQVKQRWSASMSTGLSKNATNDFRAELKLRKLPSNVRRNHQKYIAFNAQSLIKI